MACSDNFDETFPPKPERPSDSDCCGNGCAKCVFDIYEAKLYEWEKLCSDIKKKRDISGASCSKIDFILNPITYSPFVCISKKQHTVNTCIYAFQAVKPQKDSSGKSDSNTSYLKLPLKIYPGCHLIVKSNGDDSLTRAYSPLYDSHQNANGSFEIIIKFYESGKMCCCFKNVAVGDVLYWKGPFGHFSYQSNRYRHVLMVCAGTGVAPLFSIAKSIVENESDETFVRLLYSCRHSDEILLEKEIITLQQYWNFTSSFFLTREENHKHSDRISFQLINNEICNKLPDVLVLICGTPAFSKDMFNYALKCGVTENNIVIF